MEPDTRFSASGVFHESVSPLPLSVPLKPFRIITKIREYIGMYMLQGDFGGLIIAGVVVTANKLIAGVAGVMESMKTRTMRNRQ